MQCKQCGLERKDEKLVLFVLSKIGSEYPVFVSTIHFKRDPIPNWKMPSLDDFIESLIPEQDKLVKMGVIEASKNQALLMTDSNNAQSKGESGIFLWNLRFQEKEEIQEDYMSLLYERLLSKNLVHEEDH